MSATGHSRLHASSHTGPPRPAVGGGVTSAAPREAGLSELSTVLPVGSLSGRCTASRRGLRPRSVPRGLWTVLSCRRCLAGMFFLQLP